MNTPPTQYDIRYYEHFIHPSKVRAVGGVRSYVILALNWIRFWLETLVQRLLLGMISTEQKIEPEKHRAYLKTFWEDVRRDVAGSATPLVLMEKPTGASTQDIPPTVGTSLPIRPKPLDDMAARYGAPGRARLYGVSGRKLVFEEETFEPMDVVGVAGDKQ